MRKISIVTVCYNAANSIESTILSVLDQTCPDIEYIIIDGGSNDGTLDIIKKYSDKISYWSTAPDKGIYDAMNKAIERVDGEWVIFMNAGDRFVDSNILSAILKEMKPGIDVVYGDTLVSYKEGSIVTRGRFFSKSDICLPFCHQSTFVRSELMKQNRFNIKYKIAADYAFFYTLYKKQNSFQYISMIISVFDAYGFSSNQVWNTFKEVNRITNNNSIKAFLRVLIRLLTPQCLILRYRLLRYGRK